MQATPDGWAVLFDSPIVSAPVLLKTCADRASAVQFARRQTEEMEESGNPATLELPPPGRPGRKVG